MSAALGNAEQQDPQQHLQLLQELGATVAFANHGMQALMDLLACDSTDKTIRATALRTLISPIADQLEQAVPVARLLVGDDDAGAAAVRLVT